MNLHKVSKQLEGGCFKAHVAPGRIREEKAKVNVKQVTLVVDENVPVVPIPHGSDEYTQSRRYRRAAAPVLDLHQICKQRVCGQTFNKVLLSRHEKETRQRRTKRNEQTRMPKDTNSSLRHLRSEEALGVDSAKLLHKVSHELVAGLLLGLVKRNGTAHNLDQSSLSQKNVT